MRTITVHFQDGDHLVTRFNGTNEDINNYYLGREFLFGDADDIRDAKVKRCTKVAIHVDSPARFRLAMVPQVLAADDTDWRAYHTAPAYAYFDTLEQLEAAIERSKIP